MKDVMRRVGVFVAGLCAVVAMTSGSAVAAESGADDMASIAGWGKVYEWTPGHASNKRLDLATKANRANVWNDNNGSNQSWRTYSYGNNLFAFQNMANRQCLRYVDVGVQMTTIPCDNSDSYKFRGVKSGGWWTFRPLNNNGVCIDVKGRGTANGTHVVTWHCNGDSNQRWKLSEV
ncbi:hypothetical protein SUDANB95_03326 [Actinosynnema sp. ALI-1.44]